MARMVIALVLTGLLAACGGEPIDTASISRPDEIQAGPGLLTGPDGVHDINL